MERDYVGNPATMEAVIDHFGINCADYARIAGVLRPGARCPAYLRVMDVGPAIGYGRDGHPEFWIADGAGMGTQPGDPCRLRGRRRRCRRCLTTPRSARRRIAARAAAVARVSPLATTARSCAIPTATTSRPCSTAPSPRPRRPPTRVASPPWPTQMQLPPASCCAMRSPAHRARRRPHRRPDRGGVAVPPTPTANSIDWLIWHSARIQDAQVAHIAGTEQVVQRWLGGQLQPGSAPDAHGYGMSAEDVGKVRAPPICWPATTTPCTRPRWSTSPGHPGGVGARRRH